MSSYVDKPLSLVERKKLQWAKEREELSDLCAPWGSTENVYDKPRNRPRYARLSVQSNDFIRKEPTVANRRPSLPPLVPSYKHQPNILVLNDKFERELGGETSGYGSDNPNHTPEHFQQPPWNQTFGGYESSSSYRDDRPKWGDRGVGVGKFWEPKDFNEYNKMITADTPGWVKRGLQRDGELIVANSSPAESPEQTFQEPERPCTGSSGSQNRTYIRGQNVRLEPSELAERERRRQIALAHQEAIRQQLEEREQKRKEEKERRIREEREEELRIEREQEIERRRREYEENLIKEKKERERKRKEALREAMELAEKEAKNEKMKQRMLRQNINENVKEKEDSEPKQLLNNAAKPEIVEETKEIKAEEHRNDNHVDFTQKQNDICNNINNNIVNNTKESLPNNIKEKVENLNNINNNCNNNINNLPVVSPRNDNLALILQTPMETLQGMQFAVLVPSLGSQVSTNTLPIAVPITITPNERTENRILTPTQFRNRRFCDSSTQTDCVDINRNDMEQKHLRDKLAQLEIGYENRSRKERRRDERARESVEERPKWNANRPPTRYLKQSEKDPLYQRRKLRQKMRQIKTYEDKMSRYSPHSSDDSQTASPRLYRKKNHGRALWRKNEQMFSRNVVYQTEIVPLESDKDQIYYKQKCGHRCCCHCQTEKYYAYPDQMRVVDIMKIENNSPRDSTNYKNETTQNEDHRLPECTRNSSIDDTSDVIQKLNILHNGLMMKQEQWEKSPRTPPLCSSNKESP